MKRILSIISSIKTTILLLVLFATAIAVATFIENDYGTESALALVFKTKWFEILQILLILNLIINIFKFKMFNVKKIPILIFHTSFIFILIGSGLTRYMGYEGMMTIREGFTENRMLSSDSFLQINAIKNNQEYKDEHILYLSKLGNNSFNYSMDVEGKILTVKYKDLIKNATKKLVESKDGIQQIKFIMSTSYGPEEYVISDNTEIDTGLTKVFFNKDINNYTGNYIKIYNKGKELFFISNQTLSYVKMADQSTGNYETNIEYPFEFKRLYQTNDFQIVPREYMDKAVIKVVSEKDEFINKDKLSAVVVDVTYDNKTEEIALFGKGKQFKGYTNEFNINNTNISLEWGSKIITLPFSLHLKDFVLEKYSGSQSPSSYESKVILIDERTGIEKDYRIFMNNTLSHDGFTFYQSSYEKDEKGTILSVNKDPGKWPTYIGYFLLIFGLLSNLINPNSRFYKLAKTKYDTAVKIAPILSILFLSFTLQPAYAVGEDSQFINKNTRAYVNSLTKNELESYVKLIDKEHSDLFTSILIQSNDGRTKPLNTFALDNVNKITSGKNIFDLTYQQIFTGMVTKPKYWQKIELFKVKDPRINKLLGIDEKRKAFSYVESFSKEGQYKFLDAAEEALRTKPANRGNFEKEILKIDERLNAAYNIFEGEFFRAFPLIQNVDDTWYSAKDATTMFPDDNKQSILTILRKNINGINKGYEEGNWNIANEAILEVIQYQTRYAKSLPSSQIVEAEILYNKLNIFEKLYPFYLLLGLILLILIFIKLLKSNLRFKTLINTIYVLFILSFVIHTFALGLRWYVSGHAPWSNSYEAMLYISWTIILSGILFAKQSNFALSSTGIFSGITLFVAHLSWLDPQISNLVPVLKSYWLTIHVSVITASYGFLGLSAMLGFITLILFIMISGIKKESSREAIMINIKESAKINELSLTVGLSLLIIGNFLGAIWANESWGRYWGWDPKETWTLVTILIYAVIIHIRYVPKLSKNIYIFSVLTLLSYSTVLMTYFGVNYYLSGLHSYAAGDPIPIPTWIYYALAVNLVVIVFAFRSRNEIYKYKIYQKGNN